MLITELSALVGDKKEMLNIYKTAVEYAPYSFLYVNLKSQDSNKMFFINFEKIIIEQQFMIYLYLFFEFSFKLIILTLTILFFFLDFSQ